MSVHPVILTVVLKAVSILMVLMTAFALMDT